MRNTLPCNISGLHLLAENSRRCVSVLGYRTRRSVVSKAEDHFSLSGESCAVRAAQKVVLIVTIGIGPVRRETSGSGWVIARFEELKHLLTSTLQCSLRRPPLCARCTQDGECLAALSDDPSWKGHCIILPVCGLRGLVLNIPEHKSSTERRWLAQSI